MIFLHWFRRFPALRRLGGKRWCKLISKSQSVISLVLENLIFLAGKTPFQGSKDGERAGISRRDAEPAVRVSAGPEQVSVQDLEGSEARKRLKVSGQCRKCSFSTGPFLLCTFGYFPSFPHSLTFEGEGRNTVEWDFQTILTVSRRVREVRV